MAQSLYRKASLVMNPYGAKDTLLPSIKPTDGSGDFTFSRDGAGASPATRVNASGLIEKGRENTTIYSQDATNWSQVQAARDSATASDPFGGTSAGQYSATGTSAGYVYGTTSPSWSSGQVATGSIYIRDIDSTYVQLTFGTAAFGVGQYQNFDLSSGTKGTGIGLIDSTITSVGGGWYRLSITAQATSSGSSGLVVVFVPSASSSRLATPNAGQTLQIFGFQTELSLVATDYIETTTAPVSAGLLGDMPRLDYSGGATCPSLLLEPSRVNLVEHSEYFGSWIAQSGVSTTANSVTSLEGLQNAYTIQFNDNTASQFFSYASVTSGTIYTTSVFIKYKSGTNRNVRIGVYDSGHKAIIINFATDGTIDSTSTSGTLIDSGYESYGNGWYRVYIVHTGATTGNIEAQINRIALDNTTEEFYIYGAQLESGSYPTSYIPTYGSASTRGAEGGQITSVSDLIGQTEGTLYAEVDSKGQGEVANRILGISNGGQLERVIMLTRSTGFRFIVTNGGVNSLDYSNTIDTDGVHKVAITYNSSEARVYVDGVKVNTDTSITLPSSLDSVHLGKVEQNGSYANNFGGSSKQALVFPTALTDAECISLTTL